MDDFKTIKSYPFSGKKKDFKMWQIKFQAYLTYHKCVDIITDDTYEAPKKTKVLDPTISKDKIEIAKHETKTSEHLCY